MSTTKHATENTALRDLFDQALEAIPYPDLQSTSITQGDLDVDDDEDVEYSEEHTFTAGTLLDEPLEAGGWVELRREEGEVTITAFFGVARHGDWHNKDAQVLPESHAIQGQYDLESQAWDFWIDAY